MPRDADGAVGDNEIEIPVGHNFCNHWIGPSRSSTGYGNAVHEFE